MGHIAMGWWQKIPFNRTKLVVDFDIRVDEAKALDERNDEWLRIACAWSFTNVHGDTWYTELDVWDSRDTLLKMPVAVGDVKEFPINVIPIGAWKHYQFNVTAWTEYAWGSKIEGAIFNSIYIVIELAYAQAKVVVDNFWLSKVEGFSAEK